MATEILQIAEIRPRILLLARFIDIAQVNNFFMPLIIQHCLELGNYNSTMEILSGLNSSAVHRLQRTWEVLNRRKEVHISQGLPSQTLAKFNKMKEKLSSSNNHKNYREMLHTGSVPCVPFLGNQVLLMN